MALGLSFIPTQQSQDQQQQTAPQDSGVQQALQMLSLRVPRFGSQGAIPPRCSSDRGLVVPSRARRNGKNSCAA
jgi:hypothetical protein